VIAFLGADNSGNNLTEEQQLYCEACKKAGLNNCDTCDPAEIGRIDG